jgi:hypothetical protein
MLSNTNPLANPEGNLGKRLRSRLLQPPLRQEPVRVGKPS